MTVTSLIGKLLRNALDGRTASASSSSDLSAWMDLPGVHKPGHRWRTECAMVFIFRAVEIGLKIRSQCQNLHACVVGLRAQLKTICCEAKKEPESKGRGTRVGGWNLKANARLQVTQSLNHSREESQMSTNWFLWLHYRMGLALELQFKFLNRTIYWIDRFEVCSLTNSSCWPNWGSSNDPIHRNSESIRMPLWVITVMAELQPADLIEVCGSPEWPNRNRMDLHRIGFAAESPNELNRIALNPISMASSEPAWFTWVRVNLWMMLPSSAVQCSAVSSLFHMNKGQICGYWCFLSCNGPAWFTWASLSWAQACDFQMSLVHVKYFSC